MAYSKVIYGGKTLIDLTGDSITPEKVLLGATFHGPDGERKEGTSTYDADTSDATLTEAGALEGQTFYARGQKFTGNVPNRGAGSVTISDKNAPVQLPIGYYDGSGTASIDPAEAAKLVPNNIREGIQVLGVTGTMSGMEAVKAQAKTTTPATEQQVITPDDGYNYLSQVTIAAIPYTESDNAAGGKTVTIA